MRLAVSDIEHRVTEPLEFLEASNGEHGAALARAHGVDVVVADEIQSRAGAFALARTLRDAEPPFPGVIVILLDRPHDGWLATWAGADAWFTKPVDPFALTDRIFELIETRTTDRMSEARRGAG